MNYNLILSIPFFKERRPERRAFLAGEGLDAARNFGWGSGLRAGEGLDAARNFGWGSGLRLLTIISIPSGFGSAEMLTNNKTKMVENVKRQNLDIPFLQVGREIDDSCLTN